MKELTDKIIILTISLALYIPNINSVYMVIPVLTAIALSAVLSYLERQHISLGTFIIYTIICFFEPNFLFFIPLICYDIIFFKFKWIWILSFLPLISASIQISFIIKWIIGAFIIVAYILKYRTTSLESIKKQYHELRDTSKEISLKLEKKNKELLEKQDYEINVATLTERNRIARDIHDNVGHMLSRSILQIGALLITTKDEKTKENLRLLKDTLSEAMDSIRNSVHDLHEESIDLRVELQKLIDNFKFCPIEFEYDVDTNLEKNVKYCFIAVTKEALSNIIKHSNATKVLVTIREHPALFQLVIQDNGTQDNDMEDSNDSENGIGLKNISDRVNAVGGNVNISADKGFRIFISVPKKLEKLGDG